MCNISKNIICISLIFIVIYCLSSNVICKQNNEGDEIQLYSLEKLPDENEVLNLKNTWNLYLFDLQKKYPIAEIKNAGYNKIAKIPTKNGGKLFILFDKDSNGEYISSSKWYFNSYVSSKDFDNLLVGKSTLNDVRKIDGYGDEFINISRVDVPPCTIHRTQDKKIITIKYKLPYNNINTNSLIINSIEIQDDISEKDILFWVDLFK